MAAVALAFFAGILTVAAPCSLPVLPALLGVSLGQSDKARPALITIGFVVSFTAAAVFFSVTTQIAGIDQTALRTAAAVLLAAFGALMLWPYPFEWFWMRIGARLMPGDRIVVRFAQGQPRRLFPRHRAWPRVDALRRSGPGVDTHADRYSRQSRLGGRVALGLCRRRRRSAVSDRLGRPGRDHPRQSLRAPLASPAAGFRRGDDRFCCGHLFRLRRAHRCMAFTILSWRPDRPLRRN